MKSDKYLKLGNIVDYRRQKEKELIQKEKKKWELEKHKEYIFLQDDLKLNFDEWLNEKEIVQPYIKTTYDKDGKILTQGQTEIVRLKREFNPNHEEIDYKIELYLLCQKENPSIDEIKLAKYQQLSVWHKSIFETGKVPTSLDITIDARRYTHKNDLQNIQGLISRYKRGHTLPKFRDANNIDHVLTAEQLETFVIEIEDYHAEMFNKKHAWALEIESATTAEELVSIEIE